VKKVSCSWEVAFRQLPGGRSRWRLPQSRDRGLQGSTHYGHCVHGSHLLPMDHDRQDASTPATRCAIGVMPVAVSPPNATPSSVMGRGILPMGPGQSGWDGLRPCWTAQTAMRVRERRSSLVMMWSTWLPTVFSLIDGARAAPGPSPGRPWTGWPGPACAGRTRCPGRNAAAARGPGSPRTGRWPAGCRRPLRRSESGAAATSTGSPRRGRGAHDIGRLLHLVGLRPRELRYLPEVPAGVVPPLTAGPVLRSIASRIWTQMSE
jgi:hypothetical protein